MNRLKAIANFINENDVVADIGCDHGYLSIYLTQHKNELKIKQCIKVK